MYNPDYIVMVHDAMRAEPRRRSGVPPHRRMPALKTAVLSTIGAALIAAGNRIAPASRPLGPTASTLTMASAGSGARD